MGVVYLDQLEGYRPPAEMGELDQRLWGKGPDARTLVIAGSGMSPEAFEAKLQEQRQELRRQQDFAPYVGALVMGFRVKIPKRGKKAPRTEAASVIVEDLSETALTDLFKDRYGVEMDGSALGKKVLRVRASTYDLPGPKDNLTLLYQIYDKQEPQGEAESGRVRTFWALVANGVYGSVNMSCWRTSPMPLEGKGNIAFIPGVEEALFSDVKKLFGIFQARKRQQETTQKPRRS